MLAPDEAHNLTLVIAEPNIDSYLDLVTQVRTLWGERLKGSVLYSHLTRSRVQLKQTSWQNVVLGPKWETIDQVTGALGLNFAIVVTSHGSSERIIPQVGAITSYIRNLTSSHGLSMAELGRQTGFPRQTIYRIFRGRRTPHPVTQLKLLAALDCAVTYDFD